MGLLLPTSPLLHFAFTDAHSLSFNFTVNPQPRPGQPWREVQGQVDREVFLSYDCGHAKIISTSPLGEEVKPYRPGKHRSKYSETSGTNCVTLHWRKTVMGTLESPSTGGADCGLENTVRYWSFPSCPVERAAIA